MKRKLISLILALALCVGLATFALAVPVEDFHEVTVGIPEIPGLKITISDTYKTYMYSTEDSGETEVPTYFFLVLPGTVITFNKMFGWLARNWRLMRTACL